MQPAHARVPNVIIAGVSKCGTTSLFRYLASHPDVCASAVKEVNFFTHEGRDSLDLASYAPLFARCADRSFAIYLEASPIYLHYAATVAPAMHATLPDARLIFILRDPVSRFVSHFRYLQIKAGLISGDLALNEFVDGMSADGSVSDERIRAQAPDVQQCLLMGLYAANLQRFLDLFGPGRIYVDFLERLHRSPLAFMHDLCAFLNIAPDPYRDYGFTVENRRRNPSYLALNRLAEVVTLRYERFFNRHPAVRSRLRTVYHAVNPERPEPDTQRLTPAARTILSRYYAPSVHDLGEIVRRHYPAVDRPRWLADWPSGG